MTVDWHTGDTVESTCTRCQALGHGDTPHEVTVEHGGGEYSVRCSVCGNRHRDRIVGPQPGPQTEFVTADDEVDIGLYGGARGGGKSWALELIALRFAHIRGWTGLILRHELKDIVKAGGLWDKAKRCFAGTGAVFREDILTVTWGGDGGARLEFSYLGQRNIDAYQGQEYAYIAVDEATHFTIDELMTLALCNRSTCGAPTFMRWSCNPDPFHALREFVDPWVLEDGTADRSMSGHVRWFAMLDGRRVWGASADEVMAESGRPRDEIYSFAYYPSLVTDNQILLEQDPRYVGKLAMRGPVYERQMRYGDWNARPNVKGLLRKLLERTVTEPHAQLDGTGARGTDMAATEPHDGNKTPDFTAGALVLRDVDQNYYFAGLAICRREPPGVLELMRSTATLDGPRVTQGVYRDPAQAGKGYALFVAEQLRKSPRCGPVVIEPCGNQQDQKIKNAAPVAEALRQGKMFLLVGPWCDEPYEDGGEAPNTIMGLIRSQLSTFPSEKKTDKDDIIDGLGLAYKLAKSAHVVVGSPRETAAEARRLAAKSLPARGRMRYGGRR